MQITQFEYELPSDLIPPAPTRERGQARMAVLDRAAGTVEHRMFRDLGSYLDAGDVIVLNDTKVMPTLLRGRTDAGAEVRMDLVSHKGGGRWECAVRRVRPLPPGTKITFADGALRATIIGPNELGTGVVVDLNRQGEELVQLLVSHGDYMLPMYLDQNVSGEDYQTVFANSAGSNQPPVAGMHFTEQALDELARRGIGVHHITLRIGRLDDLSLLGGQRPVEEHRMYPEAYEVPAKTADAVNEARAAGHRLVCIGTTSVRTLETVAADDGTVRAGQGWTNCYITPGYRFKVVDALLSNLQPPHSTNIMLHCAFGGYANVMDTYREAVRRRYSFLEFGDCILYV